MVVNTDTSMILAKGLSENSNWMDFLILEATRGGLSQIVKTERRILVAGRWDDDLFMYSLPRATTTTNLNTKTALFAYSTIIKNSISLVHIKISASHQPHMLR